MRPDHNRLGAHLFFYCAKASAAERNRGLPDGMRNTHPTVKPLALMAYLCKLVAPPGAVILDPFMGSGSTGVAAQRWRFIGIDQDADAVAIARARIDAALEETYGLKRAQGQKSLFAGAAP